jgi:hypothetical protein
LSIWQGSVYATAVFLFLLIPPPPFPPINFQVPTHITPLLSFYLQYLTYVQKVISFFTLLHYIHFSLSKRRNIDDFSKKSSFLFVF